MSIGITYQGKLPALSGFKHADKASHAIYGGLAGGVAAAAAHYFGLPVHSAALVAAGVFVFGKEIYDVQVRKKDWEGLDILATISIPLIALFFK